MRAKFPMLKKKSSVIGSSIFLLTMVISCKTQTELAHTHTARPTAPSDSVMEFTDPRDGQHYPIVRIGATWWFAENLNYDTKLSMQYGDEKTPPYKWGRYYHITEIAHVCPTGWRIPDLKDWASLRRMIDTLGVQSLMDSTHWQGNADATNATGLNLHPSGFHQKRAFVLQYVNSSIWFNDPSDTTSHWHLHVDGHNNVYPYYFHTHDDEVFIRRFAVRCVCDSMPKLP